MKTLLLALLFVGASSFAAEETVTYQRIGGVPANEVCDNGSEFLSINPVKICTEWKHTPEENYGEYIKPAVWACQKYQMSHISISKETDVCLEFVQNETFVGCTKMGKGVQGNTVVGERVRNHGETQDVQYFDYTIKACPLN